MISGRRVPGSDAPAASCSSGVEALQAETSAGPTVQPPLEETGRPQSGSRKLVSMCDYNITTGTTDTTAVIMDQ